MMLHLGDNNLVAWLQHLAERVGHEIDRLGRTARKNDLVDRTGIEKTAHILTRFLEFLGGFIGQGVKAPVHIGVGGTIDAGHALDDEFRLLGRGRIVQIDQRPAIDLALQDREFGADGVDVQGGGNLRLDGHDSASNRRRSSALRASRRVSSAMPSSGSARKLSISRARARGALRPRWRM